MEFTVPQFIEKESKIVGPMTFKQFVFVGTAGGLCIFLYFTTVGVGRISMTTFIAMAIFIMGLACALAFVKVGKVPLPIFIKNMFWFLFKPKIFLWKKKTMPPKLVEKIEVPEEKEGQATLQARKKSRLEALFTRLETKEK